MAAEDEDSGHAADSAFSIFLRKLRRLRTRDSASPLTLLMADVGSDLPRGRVSLLVRRGGGGLRMNVVSGGLGVRSRIPERRLSRPPLVGTLEVGVGVVAQFVVVVLGGNRGVNGVVGPSDVFADCAASCVLAVDEAPAREYLFKL